MLTSSAASVAIVALGLCGVAGDLGMGAPAAVLPGASCAHVEVIGFAPRKVARAYCWATA